MSDKEPVLNAIPAPLQRQQTEQVFEPQVSIGNLCMHGWVMVCYEEKDYPGEVVAIGWL